MMYGKECGQDSGGWSKVRIICCRFSNLVSRARSLALTAGKLTATISDKDIFKCLALHYKNKWI